MRSRSKELMLEFLLLKQRYSKEEFMQVSVVLKHSSAYKELVKVIDMLQSLEAVAGGQVAVPLTVEGDFQSYLQNEVLRSKQADWEVLRERDPLKYERLVELEGHLRSKCTFATVKALQEYVSSKVKVRKAKNSRAELMLCCLNGMSERSIEELEGELSELRTRNGNDELMSGFLNMAQAIVHSRKKV
ncbi:hypothetical protein ACX1C1_13165 [Paenibacillus sp. strain BS8-2]